MHGLPLYMGHSRLPVWSEDHSHGWWPFVAASWHDWASRYARKTPWIILLSAVRFISTASAAGFDICFCILTAICKCLKSRKEKDRVGYSAHEKQLKFSELSQFFSKFLSNPLKLLPDPLRHLSVLSDLSGIIREPFQPSMSLLASNYKVFCPNLTLSWSPAYCPPTRRYFFSVLKKDGISSAQRQVDVC